MIVILPEWIIKLPIELRMRPFQIIATNVLAPRWYTPMYPSTRAYILPVAGVDAGWQETPSLLMRWTCGHAHKTEIRKLRSIIPLFLPHVSPVQVGDARRHIFIRDDTKGTRDNENPRPINAEEGQSGPSGTKGQPGINIINKAEY